MKKFTLPKGFIRQRTANGRKAERGGEDFAPPVQDKLSTPTAEMPPAASRVEADDDSRLWDIMGRLVFSADSRTSPTSLSHAPLRPSGSRVEADDDSRVWDILGRVEFSAKRSDP